MLDMQYVLTVLKEAKVDLDKEDVKQCEGWLPYVEDITNQLDVLYTDYINLLAQLEYFVGMQN